MGLKEDLINAVGAKWVSEDPAIAYCYTRTYVTDGMRVAMPERRPDFVVCPGSAEEISEILRIANKYGTHVQIMGAGQGMSSVMWGLRTAHAIMIDAKRMTFVDVDEVNRSATIYCGVHLANFSGEWRRRLEKGIGEPRRPYYTGGPGQAIAVASTMLGGQKFGLWKHAVAWYTTSNAQNVFPDGTILDTGSRAVIGVPEFWSYGPGPTLHFMFNALGGNVCAALGIITRLAFKLFPLPEVMDGLYAVYDSYEGAVEALKQLMHMEIGRGVFIGCDWTMSSYSSDSRVNSIRLSRASALVQLGIASWGTKRRVEYELKVFREIVKKTGGRIMPREFMCIWRGHNFNILGWAQTNSPREYRQLGAMGSFGVFNVPDIESVNKYINWCQTFLHTSSYLDHPVYGTNVGKYSSGLQIYPHQYGRGCAFEYIWSYDLRERIHMAADTAIFFNAHRISLDTGADPAERIPPDFAMKLRGPLYELMKKIKLEFDPNYITGAGTMFDKGLK